MPNNKLDKGYTKRYCDCEKWRETHNDYAIEKLYELLSHYPNTCPFCHKKLKTRLREIEVYIEIEPEVGGRDPFSDGVPIPLKDLKRLLEGV